MNIRILTITTLLAASANADGPATAAAKEAAILALAIERGAPLFNQGQHEACAAIYEVAARAVVALGTLPAEDRARLETCVAAPGRLRRPPP
jgi:hypothetical protein